MNTIFDQRARRIERETAKLGWDEPRSKPVKAETWKRARELVRTAQAECAGCPDPFVSPGGNGSVFLRWGRPGGAMLDVEVCEDGTFEWESAGPSGAECGEGDILSPIKRWFASLAG